MTVTDLATRPKCLRCKRGLAAVFSNEYTTRESQDVRGERCVSTRAVRGRLLGHGYAANGYYCSMSCGFIAAVEARKLEAARGK